MYLVVFSVAAVWLWFYLGWHAAIIAAAAALIFYFYYRRHLAIFSCAVVAIIVFRLEIQLNHVLPRGLQHQEVNLTACIAQSVNLYDDYLSFTAEVSQQPKERSLRTIQVYQNLETDTQQLLPGMCITGTYRLRQPIGRLVSGSFNLDRYAFANRIDAYATLVNIETIDFKPNLAARAYANFSNQFTDEISLGVWSALVLGWSSSIDAETKSLFTSNQVMHLFVISGMHIGFLAAAVYGLLYLVTFPFSRVFSFSLKQKLCISITVIWLYILFLGFPVPATRAGFMLTVPFLLLLLKVNVHWLASLSMAALMVSLVFPEAWLGVGTWLSFVSVAAILYAYRLGWLNPARRFISYLNLQVLMAGVSWLWAVIFAFPINVFSIVINFLFTPVIALMLMPLGFLTLLVPSDAGGRLIIELFQLITLLSVNVLEAFSESVIHLSWLPVTIWFSVTVIFLLLTLFRRKALYVAVLSAIFVVYLAGSQRLSTDEQVTIFDVGHGQAILIETQGERWLYDTGGVIGESLSVYERYLDQYIDHLDGVIVSHLDSDHSGGLEYVSRQYPEARILTGQLNRPQWLDASRSFRSCHDVASLNLPKSMTFIPIPKSLRTSDNDASCVLRFQSEGSTMIITGDSGKRVEYYLLQEHSELFPVDALLLGHHGSSTSSSTTWLNLHQDALFLVSTGDRARPRWPAAAILEWFEQNEKTLYSTATYGTLTLNFKDESIRPGFSFSSYRKRLLEM